MVFAYDFDRLNTFLKNILRKNLSADAWRWLEQEGASVQAGGEISRFNIAFVAMPRKTGKHPVAITAVESSELKSLRREFTVSGWTVDRLSRVWLLMQSDTRNEERYKAVIENLYLSAEMGELVALYSSLPVLAYAPSWVKRCAEGIRSNIGQVLEAIICNNPYPSEYLDEAAWNQLVLKAIFTEKPILQIVGLRERMNPPLAKSLSDYAHERWAAGRPVNPLLWICVSPFIDESNFSDIQRVFRSEDEAERHAAALACYESPFAPARQLVEAHSGMKRDIEEGKISWQRVGGEL